MFKGYSKLYPLQNCILSSNPFKSNIHLSPITSSDLAESYFYMYRLTKDPIYREYAWELAQSIYQHARSADGRYHELIEVNQAQNRTESKPDSGSHPSSRPTRFISATPKYLYLTFSEEDVMPMDRWVFSALALPLPICGRNDAFKEC